VSIDDKLPVRTDRQETDPPAGARAKKRGLAGHVGRLAAWLVLCVVVLVIVLVGGFAWYSTTEDFQKRVGKEIVSVLEDATGGRVEVGAVAFNLWHLAIEVDHLVIHGLEAPGEAPYPLRR